MVLSVENEAMFTEISFDKNGCMLLDDIWCNFIAKCSNSHLVSLFCKNNI